MQQPGLANLLDLLVGSAGLRSQGRCQLSDPKRVLREPRVPCLDDRDQSLQGSDRETLDVGAFPGQLRPHIYYFFLEQADDTPLADQLAPAPERPLNRG